MRRSLLVLLGFVLLLPGTAHADHPDRQWAPGSSMVVEDRTGSADLRKHLKTAVDHWNAVDANFTLSYRDGPADNSCSPTTGVIRWCAIDSAPYAAATFRYPEWPNNGGYTTAVVVKIKWSAISPTSPFGATHENGHAVGLDHSCVKSNQYMANLTGHCPHISTPDWSLQTDYPTAHDIEVLQSLYGVKARPAVTVAGSTWFSDGTTAKTVAERGSVAARATGAIPGVPYQFVAGMGTTSQPCRYNRVPLNRTYVYATDSGQIGQVTGTAYLNPGTYQVCFAQPDPVSGNRAVTQAGTLTVT